MCFRWLRRIYHYLRGRCSRQNRGYSNEISSHHRGPSGRGLSNLQGHGSLFCGGEGSITYSRETPSFQPMSPSSTCISGGYRCSGDGSIVITRGDSEGTSGWGIAGGTVPVYGTRRGIGCSSEDSGWNITGSSGGGGGSSCHSGSLGITVEGGYGYDAPPREMPLPVGGGSGGSGYYGGGSGYGMGGCPEFSPGSSQAMQQKCPVVVPNIEAQQSKKTSHWPFRQKK